MEIKPEYRTLKSIFKTLSSVKDWHALRTHALSQLDWGTSRHNSESRNSFGALPWWSYSCTHFLDQVVPTEATVLEIGGGASSVWWLNRGNHVITFESDGNWAEQITKLTKPFAGMHELYTFDRLAEIEDQLEGRTFDVTVNDGSVDRNVCSQILRNHQNQTGLMIWDNSDRDEYLDGVNDLKLHGWKGIDFFGLGPINAYASQTTIFTLEPINPSGRKSVFKTISN